MSRLLFLYVDCLFINMHIDTLSPPNRSDRPDADSNTIPLGTETNYSPIPDHLDS
jgi:hypothetical protein